MKKFVVMTSINGPTEAVEEFARQKDWQLVVVGDKKSPQDWHYDNVVYLGPEEQLKAGFSLAGALPWNSYGRKHIGYLYAIKNGAKFIWDTDDDNIPYPNPETPTFSGKYNVLSGVEYVNAYKHFTNEFVWPRGYPLRLILDQTEPKSREDDAVIGVWQYLADEEPDVDAIYRLTINKQIIFKPNPPIVLGQGTMCAFNSQNTFFRPELFPLLYLPSTVLFRFTDILRGMIAQPIMWLYGYKLGFGKATVLQKRNPHDFLGDLELEIEAYLHVHKIPEIIKPVLSKHKSPAQNLLVAYQALEQANLVQPEELKLLQAWLSDLDTLGIN